MSKRNKLIIIGAAVLVVIIALSVGLGVGLSKPRGSIKFKAKVTNDCYPDLRVTEIVRSPDELNATSFKRSVYSPRFNEYDEEYFREKALVVYSFASIDNKAKYTIKNVYIENEMLYLDVKVKRANTAKEYWLFLIEVRQKDVIGIEGVVAFENGKQPGSIWFNADAQGDGPILGGNSFIFTMINSVEELRTPINDEGNNLMRLEQKYDEEFFKDKSLIVYRKYFADRTNHFSVKNVFLENDILYIALHSRQTLMPQQAVQGWEIFIEVKKADIAGVTNLKLEITEEEW